MSLRCVGADGQACRKRFDGVTVRQKPRHLQFSTGQIEQLLQQVKGTNVRHAIMYLDEQLAPDFPEWPVAAQQPANRQDPRPLAGGSADFHAFAGGLHGRDRCRAGNRCVEPGLLGGYCSPQPAVPDRKPVGNGERSLGAIADAPDASAAIQQDQRPAGLGIERPAIQAERVVHVIEQHPEQTQRFVTSWSLLDGEMHREREAQVIVGGE